MKAFDSSGNYLRDFGGVGGQIIVQDGTVQGSSLFITIKFI